MRKIFVIGIGVGDPDHMTMQAIKALNRVNVFFIPDKGEEKAALRELRTSICERFIEKPDYRTVAVDVPQRANSGDYLAGVDEWHGRLAEIYGALFERELGQNDIGAVLVWGDPAIYDSTLRIIERIRAKAMALEFEVIPGISSVQVLAAKHRIALNRIGESVLLTTGRKLAEGFPADAGSVVVLLDGVQAFARSGRPESRHLLGGLSRNRARNPAGGKTCRGQGRDRGGAQPGARTAWLDHGYLSVAQTDH